jgi:hypothetical protein
MVLGDYRWVAVSPWLAGRGSGSGSGTGTGTGTSVSLARYQAFR